MPFDVMEGLRVVGDIAFVWLPIVMFALIIYLLWRSLSLMPRVKTTHVKATSRSAVTWAEVAGLDEAKAELREVVEFLRHPKQFSRLGARVPKGILLYGPPGTGKTLLAKAVAHESGASFYSQSASAFVEMFAGLGAARIRKLFEQARNDAPAIIFIDELDAVGMARTGGGIHREHDQTLNQLLVELDGFNEGEAARSSSWAPRTASRTSTSPSCGRAASTARSSSRHPTSQAARRSSACTPAGSLSLRTSTSTSSHDRPPV